MSLKPHIAKLRSALWRAIRQGGYTFDPRKGFTDALDDLRTPDTPSHLVAVRGITVPATGNNMADVDALQQAILNFRDSHAPTLAHDNYYLGLWLNEEAREWCIDIVDAFCSEAAAMIAARRNRQKTICSLDKDYVGDGSWLYPKVRIVPVDYPDPPPTTAESPTPPKTADGSGGNPKDAIGRSKAPLHLIPGPALIYQAYVHDLGARKYGPYNWRNSPVNLTVYLAAMERHLLSVLDGEDLDPESGLPHVAHIAAGCNIVLDAKEQGTLIDDRAPAGKTAPLLARLLKERGPQPKETPNV